jgi:hypothetical protein
LLNVIMTIGSTADSVQMTSGPVQYGQIRTAGKNQNSLAQTPRRLPPEASSNKKVARGHLTSDREEVKRTRENASSVPVTPLADLCSAQGPIGTAFNNINRTRHTDLNHEKSRSLSSTTDHARMEISQPFPPALCAA